MKLLFEWDIEKAKVNLKKHDVSFNEAATVFNDPLSWTYPDPEHSIGEDRYLIIGQSDRGRLLMIAHTERGNTIRIISARKATRKERAVYEDKS